ncbi:MAG: porin family protein [Prevotellaceae bacterium]|jgi:outer membrane protein X|nr:porin family protein [Prevotellaceae bacterium]
MKKVFLLKRAAIAVIVAMSINLSASAQEKGDMAVVGSLALGTGDELTNYGIGAKFQYTVMTPLRMEGSFTYFLPKKWGIAGLVESKLSMWDLSVNANWLFSVTDKLRVYPLAGVGIFGTKTSAEVNAGELGSFGDSVSSSEFGFNLGAGLDFNLTDRLFINVDAKYRLGSTWSRFLASAGIGYRF